MSYWRNPAYNATRFVFATVVALLVGTILWDVGAGQYVAWLHSFLALPAFLMSIIYLILAPFAGPVAWIGVSHSLINLRSTDLRVSEVTCLFPIL